MAVNLSRRQALLGLSATAALPLLGTSGCATTSSQGDGVFAHGVASGDPDHHSVMLWTRISVAQPSAAGTWEVAADAGFNQLLATGDWQTDASRDMTVKVLADKLAAGGQYYYRFRLGEERSPVGRTRTLPQGEVAELGLALASCSNYPFGYFNAYEAIALDPGVDFVLHLGDYIYEYGPEGYGGDIGADLGRNHQPAHEILSLTDYRQRHAQYKADPQSRAMHAAHPLIAIWDDHESANNPWRDGAENHQVDEGDWAQRRAVSLQAYYEWMPVRDPQLASERHKLWRHFQFGNLASLVTLETRHSGRAEQIEYSDHAETVTDIVRAREFMSDVVGAPERHMLSRDMEQFAAQALSESVQAGRPWRIIGNQIPMARTHAPQLEARFYDAIVSDPANPVAEYVAGFRRLGELNLPLYLDPWDGYPWARERFYRMCREAGARDLFVVTGDSHSFWQNQLFSAAGEAMGVEVGTTGITSPGDFLSLGPAGAVEMDKQLAQQNNEVLWTEGRTNGYVRLRFSPEEATVDYVGVSNIRGRDYLPVNLRRARVLRRNGQLEYA
jgi:phosphodiesterase/alkaline phosphatase D-like protein